MKTDESFKGMFDAVEKSPSYWMQVTLLEFHQSLAVARASRGILRKEDLAKLVGVSPRTLTRWLNAGEDLTIGQMCRLATALGAAVHVHVEDRSKKGRWTETRGRVSDPC